jgi:spore germination cell wall hydrolase CwlJ-like protein
MMAACLALNAYHEARHLPDAAQVNVSHVVINRAKDDRFPANECMVIFQSSPRGCQFSWYCDGKTDKPHNMVEWNRAVMNAQLALKTSDTTGGALFYHAHWVKPRWASVYQFTIADGGHRFYKPKGKQL